MGLILGKITVETPKYEVVRAAATYEVRRYPPCVVAEVTYSPTQFKGNRDGGFTVLANYIGALGTPRNVAAEKIAMTAPVITAPAGPEKIAMTAPVITSENGGGGQTTMQFVLPEKYRSADEAPRPEDERVSVKDVGERKYGVVKFSGVATEEVVKEKVGKLRDDLEKDGFKVVGDWLLARYNPPWTLPMLRTNEVMVPVE